jgi:hypothetical protein
VERWSELLLREIEDRYFVTRRRRNARTVTPLPKSSATVSTETCETKPDHSVDGVFGDRGGNRLTVRATIAIVGDQVPIAVEVVVELVERACKLGPLGRGARRAPATQRG